MTSEKKPAKKPVAAPKRESRIWKLGRLAAYCTIASTAVAVVAARSVYADAQKVALGMGSELGHLDDLGSGHTVEINGQAITVGSTTEEMSVKEVLDRAEEACKTGSSGLLKAYDEMSPRGKAGLPADATPEKAAGVMRTERNGEGVVACLVGDEKATKQGFASQMQAFLQTGDLGRLGKLRYVFAQPSSEGRTHIVSAWTDGSFNLFALTPKDGEDAIGEDMKLAPRIADSQRLMSAGIHGAPYGIYLYSSPVDAGTARGRYDQAMASLGWAQVDAPEEGAHAYSKSGMDVIVHVDPKSEGCAVTVIEMRSR